MTEKRFKHIEYYQDDGQLLYWGIDDAEKNYVHNMVDKVTAQASEETLIDLLNELNDENNRIKQTIQEAYENERTSIGKNVLKQLLEAIQ